MDDLVFHYAQIVRKPALVGPGLRWDRDFPNTYVATEGPDFVRVLVPIEGTGPTNGGTGVVAGSHLVSDSEALEEDGSESGEGAVTPVIPPGGALIIHSKMVHGGSPNRGSQDRHLFAVQLGLKDARLRYSAEGVEHLTLCSREALLRAVATPTS
jgi:ectoine hydroxylase-related dioxygenase (phytanoyl-CoA dioxygenase family)